MKYLKKYNEELRPSTYTKVGAKLKALGHNRRGEELTKWGESVDKRNKDIATKKRLEEAKKLGVYRMKILHRKYINTKSPSTAGYSEATSTFDTISEGNFYIDLYLEPGPFRENYLDWLNEGGIFFAEFGLSIIPADEETKELLSVHVDDSSMYLGAYFINWMYITFGTKWDVNYAFRGGDGEEEELELNPDGSISFDAASGDDLVAYFSDRRSAVQFKKTLVDIFNGRIIYGETIENPGGIKEFILDFLCSEQNRSLEEFERIIKSISRINVNKLYLD